MENNALVSQVLETSVGCAPDMTHALCILGNGDMGAGIVALWNAGQRNGMIKGASTTAVIFTFGISAGMMLLHRHYKNKLDEVERETADACLEYASAIYEKQCKNCTVSQVADEDDYSVTERKSKN